MNQDTSRRQFLQASAAAGVGFFVSGTRADETKPKAGIEKLNVAAIGVGGKGSSDCDNAALFGNLVAICDIDENHLNAKASKFPKAQKFTDFREMIEKLGKGIDVVTVSTPDHTHAVASSMAMKAGKHVYCQKPLTHSVAEARALRKTATDNKVCTQMGNQGTALDQARTSVDLLRSGVLGAIREVHVWTNRPTGFWAQAPKVTKRPEPQKAPKHVHWDLFLGPAPERPYAPGYHPFAWRGWRDFGTGALGDMACHTANMPYMGLRLGLPSALTAEAGDINPETFPAWARVTYEFKVAGSDKPIKLTWHEGTKDGKKLTPDLELLQGAAKGFSGSGSLIVAENATIYSPDDYGATRQMIGKGAKDIKTPEAKLPRRKVFYVDRKANRLMTADEVAKLNDKEREKARAHNDEQQKAEWFEAITKNDPKIALSNFAHAALLTESMILGNVAMIAGKRLEYDGEAGKFTNLPEFNKYLSREYRTGWKL